MDDTRVLHNNPIEILVNETVEPDLFLNQCSPVNGNMCPTPIINDSNWFYFSGYEFNFNTLRQLMTAAYFLPLVHLRTNKWGWLAIQALDIVLVYISI